MIVSETKLRELFALLPPYIDGNAKSFPIRYEWGDQSDLILFLKTIAGNKYPLIWLVEGDEKVDRITNSLTRKCRFILAKDSKHIENRNPLVWDTEFEDCLNPLLKNVLTLFDRSGITTILDTHTVRRVANYTEEDLMKATDFWNVIVLDIDLAIDGRRCINNNLKF